jgi:hypothetical protein
MLNPIRQRAPRIDGTCQAELPRWANSGLPAGHQEAGAEAVPAVPVDRLTGRGAQADAQPRRAVTGRGKSLRGR